MKLCLLVVCLALIIPKFKFFFFFIKIRFLVENYIYMPVSAYIFAGVNMSTPAQLYICNTKKKNRIHGRVFGKFPIHQYFVCIYYSTCPFFRFHMFTKE